MQRYRLFEKHTRRQSGYAYRCSGGVWEVLRKHLMWLNPFVDSGFEGIWEVMRCSSTLSYVDHFYCEFRGWEVVEISCEV